MSRDQRLSRIQERQGFTQATRLRLLETDADDCEAANYRMAEELSKIRNVLVALLISVSTACVLLAINIGVNSR